MLKISWTIWNSGCFRRHRGGTKKISKTYKISEFIDNIVDNMDTRFRIELLMFPDWATKNKMYKIKNDYYTHVRIKRSLI